MINSQINILSRIKNGEVLLCDGAMGTLLMKKVPDLKCPEKVNLESPEVLEEIAKLYFNAGADIIQTNTFGATPLKLNSFGLENKAEEINKIAVQCVKKIVKNNAYIVGSCGPTGKILKPYGDTEPEEIYKSFYIQVKSLIEAGVDIISLETMIDIEELKLGIKAVREIDKDFPIIASLTYDKTPRGYYTAMGINIPKACKGLKDKTNIIGSNCGTGIDEMIEIAQEYKANTPLPIMIQPNAGIPKYKDGKLIYPDTSSYMAEKIKILLELGVQLIGGCCGTSPEYIKKMRKVIDAYLS